MAASPPLHFILILNLWGRSVWETETGQCLPWSFMAKWGFEPYFVQHSNHYTTWAFFGLSFLLQLRSTCVPVVPQVFLKDPLVSWHLPFFSFHHFYFVPGTFLASTFFQMLSNPSFSLQKLPTPIFSSGVDSGGERVTARVLTGIPRCFS